MRLKIVLLASTLVVSCGKDKNGESAVTDAATSQVPVTQQQPKQQQQPSQLPPGTAQNEGLQVTVLLAGQTLPTCDASIKGKTYYVQEVDEFKYCDAAGNWTVIGLKGDKGETGTSGTNGTAISFACYDGNGTKIGYPIPGASCSGLLLLTEGIVISVDPYSGQIASPLSSCWFEQQNCQGNCIQLNPFSSYNKLQTQISRYNSSFYKIPDNASPEASVTVQSDGSYNSMNSTWSCSNRPSPQTYTNADTVIYRTQTYNLQQQNPIPLPVYPDFDH